MTKYFIQKLILALTLTISLSSLAANTDTTSCNGINYETYKGILIYFGEKMTHENTLWFGDRLTIVDGMDDTESLIRYEVDAMFTSFHNGQLLRKIRLKPKDFDPQGNDNYYIFITPLYDLNGNLEKLVDVSGTPITGGVLSSHEINCVTN